MSRTLVRVLILSVCVAPALVGCADTAATDTQNSSGEKKEGTPSPPDVEPNPIKPLLSGNIPLSIGVPKTVTTDVDARPFFDQFSWHTFIALNWPSTPGSPGVPLNPDDPDTFRKAPEDSTTVWGSYKEVFDLFGTGEERPTRWDENRVINSPCGDQADGQKMLLMTGKGSNVLSDTNEAFSFPLIDQNSNYVWAEIRFDEAQYNFIRGEDKDPSSWLYLKKNLVRHDPVSMPASSPPSTLGSVMVKASWRLMTDKDEKGRYYTVTAQIYDPDTKTCTAQEVGLVGFHIAHKLQEFPEWVWSSFEQVDNVERGHGATDSTPISFNNGTDSPATPNGWANRPEKKVPPLVPMDARTPAQITRFNPIPTTPDKLSTVDVNTAYQELLKGTVWEYYQLVITQWPTNPDSFRTIAKGGIYPQDCGQPFPVDGCTNTALESFLQSPTDAIGAGGNSCMKCHYGAASSDFSWALQNRSH